MFTFKKIAIILLLSFCSSNVFAEEIVGRDVRYMKGAKFSGYFAYPKQAKNAPALVMIHEWWGLNDHIKDVANRFARKGYVVLAVDMYEGKSTTSRKEARKLSSIVRNDMPAAFVNLRAAVDYLKARKGQVDPQRLASIGWCFGGMWSLNMAKNNLSVKASIIFYGRFSPRDDLSKMKAKIQGHFGDKDMSIKVETVKELQASLKTHSGDHQIFIYPNSQHAFFNDQSKRFNPSSAKLAWSRTLEFLKRHL